MKKKPELPLKGFMVGNGVTDFERDVWPAYIPTVYNFQLIPKQVHDDIVTNKCTHSFRHVLPENLSQKCNDTWQIVRGLTDKYLNWYDLLKPNGNHPSSGILLSAEERMKEVVVDGEVKTYKRGRLMSEYTPWMKHLESGRIVGDGLTDYINRADVRTAMNIPASLKGFNMCVDEEDGFFYYP